jgi:hypothetical protein
VFSVGEQRELHQIEKGLRADGRQFARRLAARQAVVRWAAPGRQDFLLAAAAVGGGRSHDMTIRPLDAASSGAAQATITGCR